MRVSESPHVRIPVYGMVEVKDPHPVTKTRRVPIIETVTESEKFERDLKPFMAQAIEEWKNGGMKALKK